jgi:hypothetical protein
MRYGILLKWYYWNITRKSKLKIVAKKTNENTHYVIPISRLSPIFYGQLKGKPHHSHFEKVNT